MLTLARIEALVATGTIIGLFSTYLKHNKTENCGLFSLLVKKGKSIKILIRNAPR